MSERAPLTQIRIAKICELMRALKWKRGVTVYELAKEWDIGESWALELSSEASRIIRAELRDVETVKDDIGLILTAIAAEAYADSKSPQLLVTENGTRQESPNAYRKTAIEAAKTLGDILGAKAPTEVKTTGDGPRVNIVLLNDEGEDE